MVGHLKLKPHAAFRRWPIDLLRRYTSLFCAGYGVGKLRRGNLADGLEVFLSAQVGKSFGFFRIGGSAKQSHMRGIGCGGNWQSVRGPARLLQSARFWFSISGLREARAFSTERFMIGSGL